MSETPQPQQPKKEPDKKPQKKKERIRPVVSTVLDDGTLVETLYRPVEHRTLFCLGKGGEVSYVRSLLLGGERLVPYSPGNNLLVNDVVLLPSEPEEYGTEEALVAEVQAFLHRYVDLSPLYERISAYYVLLTWLHDAFNELPYLRVQGDYGSGKTRFLLTVGSVCYKPIFASGASTVSPLFRILDAVRGTLIIDEGDFRYSDERAEIVKILNNGSARGFPVLRSEVRGKEYNPTAFHVFGPKLVATRGPFQDRALESRCLTEPMGQRPLREDVPISLPDEHAEEALALRNKLLLFRLRNLGRSGAQEELVDRTIEPRLSQVFTPLLSVISDEKARDDLRALAREVHREMIHERGMDLEAQILEVIRDLLAAGRERPQVKEISTWVIDRHGDDYERRITPRWVGSILRNRLGLKTHKSHGSYVVAVEDGGKLGRLYERYGVEAEGPAGGPPPPAGE